MTPDKVRALWPYLTDEERRELNELLAQDFATVPWRSLPGPQTMARNSLADIVGYPASQLLEMTFQDITVTPSNFKSWATYKKAAAGGVFKSTDGGDNCWSQTEILRGFNARLADLGLKPVSKGAFSRYSVRVAIEARKLEASRQITDAVLSRMSPEDRSDSTLAAVELLKFRILSLVMDEDAQVLSGALQIHKEEHITHPYTGKNAYRLIAKVACKDADGKTVIGLDRYFFGEDVLGERALRSAAGREPQLRVPGRVADDGHHAVCHLSSPLGP